MRAVLLQWVRRAWGKLREPEAVWPYLHIDPTSYGGRVMHHRGDPPHEVRVGRYCSIAGGAEFLIGGNHRTDWTSTYPFRVMLDLPGAFEDGMPASRGPIIIGNDVWIGRNAMILSGVTVGNGAVVGAEAVVTRDVRPYAVVAGNPAREVRRRFTDEQVDALQELRWWDWPDSGIRDVVHLLNGAPVDELIAYGNRRGY